MDTPRPSDTVEQRDPPAAGQADGVRALTDAERMVHSEMPVTPADASPPPHEPDHGAPDVSTDAHRMATDEQPVDSYLDQHAPRGGRPREIAEQPPDEPGFARPWSVIARDTGVRSFPDFPAAERALGTAPGTSLYQVVWPPGRYGDDPVGQPRPRPGAADFTPGRLASTDNIARVPTEAHQAASAYRTARLPGFPDTVQHHVSRRPWDEQFNYGAQIMDIAMKRRGHVIG